MNQQLRQKAKRLLRLLAPRVAITVSSMRSRAHSHRLVARWGNDEVVTKLTTMFGTRVQAGSFAGMTLPEITHVEQLGPYLLGTYESELRSAWTKVLSKDYSQVIDIGSKFGYYAVGLARRYPSAEVIAFDTDPWARRATREVARVNGCTNVRIETFCDTAWLISNLTAGSFIISDCEGYEAVLFGESTLDKLSTSTMLIEAHESFVPGICKKLTALFSKTHQVSLYTAQNGRLIPDRLPPSMTEAQLRLATTEPRTSVTWLLFEPV